MSVSWGGEDATRDAADRRDPAVAAEATAGRAAERDALASAFPADWTLEPPIAITPRAARSEHV